MNGAVPMTTREVLLLRKGLVFVDAPGAAGALDDRFIQAVEIKLAELGYALSTRLREQFTRLPLPALIAAQQGLCETLAAALGANRPHEPLFRKFPDDVPRDTRELWFKKVISFYCQTSNQTCLFCGQEGTTHVLRPCYHVVCDHCFDGSNYSACPVCERKVDRSSPFFVNEEKPTPATAAPAPMKLKRLDVGRDLATAAQALFVSFCERKQAMSPNDRDAFLALLSDFREEALSWIPPVIPVKENVAIVFGTLLRTCSPEAIWPTARQNLKSATDLLRLIAAFSGADPALQAQRIIKVVPTPKAGGWKQCLRRFIDPKSQVHIPMQTRRFKVAKLPRAMRRRFLEFLDGLDRESLLEDFLRHPSYWVWVGEFLHPHEYATRYPRAAEAFALVRKKSPEGTPAPAYQTFAGKLETAAKKKDCARFAQLLSARPGEFARRFDHALRLSAGDDAITASLLTEFEKLAGSFSTPVLLTLRNFLPTRSSRVVTRVFWPKGSAAKAFSILNRRATKKPSLSCAASFGLSEFVSQHIPVQLDAIGLQAANGDSTTISIRAVTSALCSAT